MLTSPRRCIGDFNPLPSYEGRRPSSACKYPSSFISIHSPHMRGDGVIPISVDSHARFQSTPLIRGETIGARLVKLCDLFQSTPLIRGETRFAPCHYAKSTISIHSPHTRGDSSRSARRPSPRWHFNPLPSYEGRPVAQYRRELAEVISIHSPHTRGDYL